MKKLISSLLIAALLMACLTVGALAASSVYFTGSCHVYTGPGSGYKDLGIVNKGSTLDYLGYSRKDGTGTTWYNVDFHGDSGWACSDYCRLSDKSGAATYGDGGQGGSYRGGKTGTFAYGTDVNITGNCNIRSGPSLSDKSRGTAHKGDVMTGTGSISTDSRGIDWYSVRYKGETCWVSSVYAELDGYSGGTSYGTVYGDSGDSNVRTGPGLGYSKLGVLYDGDSAPYQGKTSYDDRGVAWYKIRWNGSTAWVSSRYTILY